MATSDLSIPAPQADTIPPSNAIRRPKSEAQTVTGDTSGTLEEIRRTSVQLAIWQRTLPLCLDSWIRKLDACFLPNLRVLVKPSDLRNTLQPLLDEGGTPDGDMRRVLVGDIDYLVSRYAGIFGSEYVDVRLETVTHDACWKFHRDCVEARLLTTYRGPATEWVRQRHAERALTDQTRYDGPLERMRTHDVSIFKGSCAAPASGIVHRSPPIAGTGQTRLLLCLNKPSATSPEPSILR